MQPIASQSLCQGATPTDLVVSATGGIGTLTINGIHLILIPILLG
jgi:hypothetical protein